MKTRIFIWLMGCFVCCQANAQTFNNTIVNDNSSWAALLLGGAGYGNINYVETQYVYFEGDSTVDAISYKKVFLCNDKLHENIKYEGLMREQDKKTYFIPANSETEYLLYDFSLEEGMGFEYMGISFYVKNTDIVEINGVSLKQIQLAEVSVPDYSAMRATWIETIGSLNGLFYPNGMLNGVKRELLCYYQNDELIYKNPIYSKCYYDNPDDIDSIQTIVIDDYNIYPNPVDDILTIFSSNNTISYIEIFDILGEKVYSQTYDNNTIDISSFSKGSYMLKVYDTNKQISIFKIIKK